ncbi:hypothetical protein [Corallococcus exercitus]|uniref:GIY-YIG domain-containing protein n=1 Tax=Corallococcus exercitus TaxID=2316736 RepID=A0A7Y4JRD1_9BACT|nr:hypothetical protein [Corallococcus exercitus]NOK08822.1 hypothetical protein [Corallococcus exercitus]
MIDDKIIQVHADYALDALKPKLNAYRHFRERVYIGVTASPEKRWKKHQGKGWKKMVLIYEAYSTDIAERLERGLINYARQCRYRVEIENVGDGGEGLSTTRQRHFLYLLVD